MKRESQKRIIWLINFITVIIFLSVNVLKKEIAFSKDSPVVNITVAGTEEQEKSKRKPVGGRKRSASKVEDDNLVKRLKVGESVERNERQTKMLDDLNLGM